MSHVSNMLLLDEQIMYVKPIMYGLNWLSFSLFNYLAVLGLTACGILVVAYKLLVVAYGI